MRGFWGACKTMCTYVLDMYKTATNVLAKTNVCCVFQPAFVCCAHQKIVKILFWAVFYLFFVHFTPFSVIFYLKLKKKKRSKTFKKTVNKKGWKRLKKVLPNIALSFNGIQTDNLNNYPTNSKWIHCALFTCYCES